MEYQAFAKYYDQFYQKKDYRKEIQFVSQHLTGVHRVLDVGCGTGIHASLLEQLGYQVDILDLNQEMLLIAQTRVTGNIYCQNILALNLPQSYDAIISMFAVINHLDDTKQLTVVLKNLQFLIKRSAEPNDKNNCL